jgi:hypothetical protein
MAEMTVRDRIWQSVLTTTWETERALTIEEVVNQTGAAERTVRETLLVISETPFIDRQMNGGKAEYRRSVAFRGQG